jgi:hypothetical protein
LSLSLPPLVLFYLFSSVVGSLAKLVIEDQEPLEDIGYDRELAGVVLTAAMVHGFQNREHRGYAGRKANSPQNKIQPRGGPRGVPAMAGGGELTGAMKFGATEPHSPNRVYGEDAEGMENSAMSQVRPGKARGAPAMDGSGETRRSSGTRP